VEQAERTTRVEEGSDEQQAERDPEPRLVERATRLVVPRAGQQEVHLGPGPDLEHAPCPAADVDLDDSGVAAAVGHLPAVLVVCVAGNRDQALERTLRLRAVHLGHARGDVRRLAGRNLETRRLRTGRGGDDVEGL
jgi:hypothetical protein